MYVVVQWKSADYLRNKKSTKKVSLSKSNFSEIKEDNDVKNIKIKRIKVKRKNVVKNQFIWYMLIISFTKKYIKI